GDFPPPLIIGQFPFLKFNSILISAFFPESRSRCPAPALLSLLSTPTSAAATSQTRTGAEIGAATGPSGSRGRRHRCAPPPRSLRPDHNAAAPPAPLSPSPDGLLASRRGNPARVYARRFLTHGVAPASGYWLFLQFMLLEWSWREEGAGNGRIRGGGRPAGFAAVDWAQGTKSQSCS
ncbi:hypothetical protein EJB05_05693, partial [Eragrostis curvula]